VRALLAAAVVVSLVAFNRAQVPSGSPPADETPTQFYLRYRATVPTASHVDQVMALLSSDIAQEFKAAPPAERVGLDDIKKMYGLFTNVKVMKEEGTPNSVTLSLGGFSTADNRQAAGTVQVVKEGGAWRTAGLERWK